MTPGFLSFFFLFLQLLLHRPVALDGQQLLFNVQPAVVPRQPAPGSDDSVAGNHQRQPVVVRRNAHRPPGFGTAGGFGNFPVGAGFAVRDVQHGTPHFFLEAGSFHANGKGEFLPLFFQVFLNLPAGLLQDGSNFGAIQVVPGVGRSFDSGEIATLEADEGEGISEESDFPNLPLISFDFQFSDNSRIINDGFHPPFPVFLHFDLLFLSIRSLEPLYHKNRTGKGPRNKKDFSHRKKYENARNVNFRA